MTIRQIPVNRIFQVISDAIPHRTNFLFLLAKIAATVPPASVGLYTIHDLNAAQGLSKFRNIGDKKFEIPHIPSSS